MIASDAKAFRRRNQFDRNQKEEERISPEAFAAGTCGPRRACAAACGGMGSVWNATYPVENVDSNGDRASNRLGQERSLSRGGCVRLLHGISGQTTSSTSHHDLQPVLHVASGPFRLVFSVFLSILRHICPSVPCTYVSCALSFSRYPCTYAGDRDHSCTGDGTGGR